MSTSILVLSLVLGADTESAIEIEKKVLAERVKIERGEVHFDVIRRQFERTGELRNSETSRYEVTFDGSNVRTIKNRREWYVFTDQYELSHWGSRDEIDPKPAYQRDLTTPEGRRGYSESYRINLRLLGIAPDDTRAFKTQQLSEFLTQPNRENTNVTELTVDGRKVVKIEYNRTDRPVKKTFVIDPEKNYSVIEASSETPDSLERIENKLKLYDDKQWYPETVRYTRSFNTKVTSESVVTVKKAVFNQPIEKEVFTFKGISLPVGTVVWEIPGTRMEKYWDGEKLVPKNELDPDIKEN